MRLGKWLLGVQDSSYNGNVSLQDVKALTCFTWLFEALQVGQVIVETGLECEVIHPPLIHSTNRLSTLPCIYVSRHLTQDPLDHPCIHP